MFMSQAFAVVARLMDELHSIQIKYSLTTHVKQTRRSTYQVCTILLDEKLIIKYIHKGILVI